MRHFVMSLELSVVKWFSISDLQAAGYDSGIAQVPTPCVVDDTLHVFVSGRGVNNQSYISRIEISCEFSIKSVINKVLEKSTLPGTFDDEGVMPAQIMRHGNRYIMFYSGWNSRNTIPYHNATGIAVSEDLHTWNRKFSGPILDRISTEPYLAVTPWVSEEGPGDYQMLYISGTGYRLYDGRYEPLYTVKYAYSKDLIQWNRPSEFVMPQEYDAYEFCFSHPSFVKLECGNYLVMACIRSSVNYRDIPESAYRIVWGITRNLNSVERIEAVVYETQKISKDDCQHFKSMQAYPSLFLMDDKIMVLFNGNSFGRSGFGIASVTIT
jgi:hypothetical protein